MKLRIDREVLKRKIMEEPDGLCVEAGDPRVALEVARLKENTQTEAGDPDDTRLQTNNAE